MCCMQLIRGTSHCQTHNTHDSIMGKTIMVFREPPRSLYKANNGNGLYLAETKAMTEGFPGSSVVKKKKKKSSCQYKRHRFDPWVRKIPWKRKWQPTPIFFPEKSQGQRSLMCYSPWGCKELDMT